MFEIDLKAGVINSGDPKRIMRVMQKAYRGERIVTAFLGGSITQGSLATTPDRCYAYLVYKWWCETFPQSKVEFINAGIGATTSYFGVSRVREHVLSKKPDFVLVEFAVNDKNTDLFEETYEGLVRNILKDEGKPALLLMNNVCYD
ncbi:MAG: SGNH/GDSL hydrolase family protein, partial [Lachnospiraceae bacterium]|nr:SGNH/GDSL hydrolase family protein [Lachnospiraceae bacterium]